MHSLCNIKDKRGQAPDEQLLPDEVAERGGEKRKG